MKETHNMNRNVHDFAMMAVLLVVLTLTAEALADQIDRNRDTLIGRSEYHDFLRESFFLSDSDKDGNVNAAELSLVTKQQFNEGKFNKFDANGDGGIDINEFQRALALDFEAADRNKDGALSSEEFNRYFR